MPKTDGKNPSKYGFKTEKEAWEYINQFVCNDCKNGLYGEPCYAEWDVECLCPICNESLVHHDNVGMWCDSCKTYPLIK